MNGLFEFKKLYLVSGLVNKMTIRKKKKRDITLILNLQTYFSIFSRLFYKMYQNNNY